ncbi:MAG TPA: protealysin inhibitor emfourin [Dermatophilaceae bacterium]|nr:protealysin inhibitor emfourin [Dermatophilaceae bacterium]
MQVKLVRSGGIAGLNMVATVDTVELPADQQVVVSKLLAEDLRGPGVSRPGGADQFTYQLEIQHGDRTVRREWEEPEVHETVRPLLAELTRRAKPTR